MNMGRILGLAVCLLSLVSSAGAQIRTIAQTMDYTYDNWSMDPYVGVWFADPSPGVHLDNSPFYRTDIEDWNWQHDFTAIRPSSALAIQSATLTIIAWDVGTLAQGEDHYIYIGGGLVWNASRQAYLYDKTGVNLGLLKDFYTANVTVPWPAEGQRTDYAIRFSQTVFTIPTASLNELWTTGKLRFWIDIDQYEPNGSRVTLVTSKLTVDYLMPESPAGTLPVYRFWSGQSHFYTASETEKQKLIDNYSSRWIYEGIAYYALPLETTDPNARPVYRFWYDAPVGEEDTHFYTMSPTERDKLLQNYSNVWAYEGPVFCAYPEGSQPADTYPVYRFWSGAHHFYTISEVEKQKLIDNYSNRWTYEGIAWYAYVP